jgi:metaxin
MDDSQTPTHSQLLTESLRVQAYLRFVGIDLQIVPSNNHASPTGALPFLLPALPAGTTAPIPLSKLQKWAIEQVHCEEEQQLDVRFEVYASLLDHRIRNAWVRSILGMYENRALLTCEKAIHAIPGSEEL